MAGRTTLDQISRVIGSMEAQIVALREQLDDHNDQSRDGQMRVKDQIDKVVANMHTLPPSPACIAKHRDIDEDISSLKYAVARQSAYWGGAIAALVFFKDAILKKLGL
jgi:hypothetical protein